MTRLIRARAAQARMANLIAALAMAAATLGLSTQGAAACNIKGKFCGYPGWAANAFTNPRDRVPESALEPSHYEVAHRSRHEKVAKTEKVRKAVRKAPPLVKFADGFGRQFDPMSKVWFDGRSQCWAGSEQFTFKTGGWFYGKREWAEAKGTWKVASGRAPELVSCESVPSFAAIAARTAARAGKIEKAENTDRAGASGQPASATPSAEHKAAATAPNAVKPAAAAECKKYFPSVGLMLPVPCTE